MEVSSSVDAVVITATIVESALIYIWVIKNGANILKLRVVLLGAKPAKLIAQSFISYITHLLQFFLNKKKKKLIISSSLNGYLILQQYFLEKLELLRFLQGEASRDHPKGREMAREILSL